MKSERKRYLLAITVVLTSIVACRLPSITPATPFVYPTTDLTRTALSEFVETIAYQTPIAPTATATYVLPVSATPTPSVTLPTPTPTNTHIPPSATPTATATPVSFVGPAVRPGTKIKAYYLRQEPTIDGVFDEWVVDRYPVDRVVYGSDHWSGKDDLSANVMFGWDDYHLYIAARVIDDEYAQNATGNNLFKGDSLEVLLDTKVANDFYMQSLSLDDYQLGISSGSLAPGSSAEAYLWYPRSLEGDRELVEIGATLKADGYRVEVEIPWSTFEIIPVKGKHYGFAFSVSDNDRSDKNVQQSMVSTSSKRRLTDPTTWGDLVLMGQYSP